jgi:predicted esterase
MPTIVCILLALSVLIVSARPLRPLRGTGRNNFRHLDENLPGIEKTVHTHLGDLTIRIIGKEGPGMIPVVALPGANPALQNEWIPVAKRLSENGYVVCIPDFHTNKDFNKREAVAVIHEAIFRNSMSNDKAVIMGKSFGGALAQAFASAYPNEVSKLVLIAPAVSSKPTIAMINQSHIKVFLGLTRDDPVVPHSTADVWKETLNPNNLIVFSVDSGGHRIVDDFVQPIILFLKQ